MKKVIVAIAVLVGMGAAANAFEVKDKLEVGMGLGLSIPVVGENWSDSKTGFESGTSLDLTGDYKLDDKYAVGVDLTLNSAKDYQNPLALTQVSETFLGAHGRMNFKDLELFAGKKGQLYGIAGLGFHYSTVETVGLTDEDSTRFGINFGAGYDMEVATQIKLGLQLRYYHVFNIRNVDQNTGEVSKGSNGTFVPSVKVAYCF